MTSSRPGTKKLEQETPVNIIEKKEIEEKIPQSHDELFKGKAGATQKCFIRILVPAYHQ